MKLKKKLIGGLVAFFILVAVVAACFLFLKPPWKKSGYFPESANLNLIGMFSSDEPSSYQICASEDCVLAAARILKHMDVKSDPCEDFYQYSCGNFLHSHSLPDGWKSYGNADLLQEEIHLKIKGIMDDPPQVNESESLTRAKEVYQNCMDTSHIEESSVDELKRVLSGSGVGDWPFLDSDWKDCRLDVEWRMARMNAIGLDSLFHLETRFLGEDYRLFAILSVSAPLVNNICEDELHNLTEILEKASEHREVLESVLNLLDVEMNNDTEKEIEDLFQFDYSFCSVTKESRSSARVLQDLSESNVTLVSLSDMAPQINWFRWRNIIFSELRLNFPHDKQHIYVDGIETSITAINDLLHNTSSKVLANYLTWKFVLHHLGFLGKAFRQILENHSHLLSHQNTELVMNADRWLPRWRQCVDYITKLMPLAILQEYALQIDIETKEKEMEQMVPDLANEFRMILKDTRDLLKNDQVKSAHKLDLIQYPLTFPNKKSKFFDTYYSDMGKMGDSFLENGLKLLAIRMRKLMEGVSESKTVYDMDLAMQLIYSAFSAETYSFFGGNQVVISLGALQTSPISKKFPKFLPMSSFGWQIGHELAHGFDLLALDGSTRFNWTWWPSYVLKFAKSKAHCYLEFFSYPRVKYLEEAIKTTSLNEDLCDSQGMYLAFRAYLRHLADHGDDAILPGLPFTNQKLFFINYAQQFCEIRKSPEPKYSPGYSRVNRVLQNFPLFAETFKCSYNKPMYAPKCDPLWL